MFMLGPLLNISLPTMSELYLGLGIHAKKGASRVSHLE